MLDIGCGSGRAVCRLAAEFPNSRFVGYDLCDDAVAAARAEAERQGLNNIRFETRDVSQLGEKEKFDLITAFDAIHDQAKPDVVLREIVAALRPGGTFLMQDILASSHLEKNLDNPIAPFLYTISTMHCMTVSLAQGGAGLGTCWGRELAEKMLRDAGLARHRRRKAAARRHELLLHRAEVTNGSRLSCWSELAGESRLTGYLLHCT